MAERKYVLVPIEVCKWCEEEPRRERSDFCSDACYQNHRYHTNPVYAEMHREGMRAWRARQKHG